MSVQVDSILNVTSLASTSAYPANYDAKESVIHVHIGDCCGAVETQQCCKSPMSLQSFRRGRLLDSVQTLHQNGSCNDHSAGAHQW